MPAGKVVFGTNEMIGKGRRGPITETVQTAFFDLINGKTADRYGWLEYVYPGEPRPAVAAAETVRV